MAQIKGIALIVTMLIAIILIITLIGISSSLSISGKRVTTKQKIALEAQYAAESGLSLAAANVMAIGREVVGIINQNKALVLPETTDWARTITPYVQSFCGRGVSLLPPDGTKHKICVTNLGLVSWLSGNEPYRFLVDFVAPDFYPIDPDTGRKHDPQKYWSQRIGFHKVNRTIKPGTEKNIYTVSHGFVPMEVWAFEDNSIHFIFKAAATSVGKVVRDGHNLAVRKVKQEFAEKLEIILSPPSFSRYMSFTNYQRAGLSPQSNRVYFYNGTYFDGPVHTNEHFNFINKPWFGDDVTSAGCIREDAQKENCLAKIPAFYYWNSSQRISVRAPAPPDSRPPYAEPIYTKSPIWDDEYIPLPKAGDAQKRAAKDSGLYIEDNWSRIGDFDVRDVVLSIGQEGSNKYQYIQVWGLRLTNITQRYGYCARNNTDGGGGDGAPSPEDNGPDVNYKPNPIILAAFATINETLPAYWLVVLPRWAKQVGALLRGQAHNCPDGYHWVPLVPPVSVKRGTWEVQSYRIDQDGRMEKLESGTWVQYRDYFNGVIYSGKFNLRAAGNRGLPSASSPKGAHNPRHEVASRASCRYTHTTWKGKHYCIEPSIASFSQITVAGQKIGIPRDITYEDRPCKEVSARKTSGSVKSAVCDNLEAKNILGIYADEYDIKITKEAPPSMFIDAVLMSGKRSVFYHYWDNSKRGSRGYLHLTGGIIQNWYGRFGRLNPNLTIRSGYGRKFTYDRRMRDGGLTPPFFPTFERGRWRGSARFKSSGGGSGFWTPVEGN